MLVSVPILYNKVKKTIPVILHRRQKTRPQ